MTVQEAKIWLAQFQDKAILEVSVEKGAWQAGFKVRAVTIDEFIPTVKEHREP